MERYLIEHCSPTLASLKTANLFNYTFCSEDELEKHLEGLAATLEPKGVSITILRKKVRSALIYVYREKKLRTDLNHPNACKILRRNGYADTSVDAALAHLKMRFASCGESKEFPHEIGLFLGYPPDDVAGYILNSGKNCKCCGCWKVYCNECETVKTFAKFAKCKKAYKSMFFQKGKTLHHLTIAV